MDKKAVMAEPAKKPSKGARTVTGEAMRKVGRNLTRAQNQKPGSK